MDIDGGNKRVYPLSEYGVFSSDVGLTYSPDGTSVLLNGYPDASFSTYDAYRADVATGEVTRLTTDGGSLSINADWLSIPNTPPVATNDTVSVPFNTPRLIDVLTNDSDEEALSGANLSISTLPTHGSASVISGKVRYAPTLGYQGGDSLAYQICDSFLLDQKCSVGTLTITVSAPTAPNLVVTNVNGGHFSPETNKYTTSSLRPTFSGTATPGAEVKVEIHSDPIVLTTAADGGGNWSVTPGFDLPTGEHMVYISATLSGLTTSLGAFGLSIQPSLANTGESLGWIVGVSVSMMGGSLVLLNVSKRKLARVKT
jgi:hypothetical protein